MPLSVQPPSDARLLPGRDLRCTSITARFGDEPLDGLRWGVLVAWPGPIHKGNGTMQVIVDERANAAQRAAVESIAHGKASTPASSSWSIYAAMTSTFLPTLSKPIDLTFDYDDRTASVRVARRRR